MEKTLSLCETRLLAVGNGAVPIRVVSPCTVDPLSKPDYADSLKLSLPLVACGLMLGILTSLPVVRQAWYAWGGEGTFAFPFDGTGMSGVTVRQPPPVPVAAPSNLPPLPSHSAGPNTTSSDWGDSERYVQIL